jgi:hypothetical protein
MSTAWSGRERWAEVTSTRQSRRVVISVDAIVLLRPLLTGKDSESFGSGTLSVPPEGMMISLEAVCGVA